MRKKREQAGEVEGAEPVVKKAKLQESLWGNTAFADASIVIVEDEPKVGNVNSRRQLRARAAKKNNAKRKDDSKAAEQAQSLDHESHTMPVSKGVLALHSTFFRGMFSSGMVESRESVAEIRVAPGETAACIETIRYLYTGEFESTEPEHLLACVRLSDRFQLEHVRKDACDLLIAAGRRELNGKLDGREGESDDGSSEDEKGESEFGTAIFESLLALPESLSSARWFEPVRESIRKDILHRQDYLNTMWNCVEQYDGRVLALLLSSDELRMKSENDVFAAACFWYHSQSEDVCKDTSPSGPVASVLSAIRFGAMDLRYLVTFVRKCSWSDYGHEHAMPNLQEAIEFLMTTAKQRLEKLEGFSQNKLKLYTSRAKVIGYSQQLVWRTMFVASIADLPFKFDSENKRSLEPNSCGEFTHSCLSYTLVFHGVAAKTELFWTERERSALRIKVSLVCTVSEETNVCGSICLAGNVEGTPGTAFYLKQLFAGFGDGDEQVCVADVTVSDVRLFYASRNDKFDLDKFRLAVTMMY